MSRPIFAKIDLAAIKNNYNLAKSLSANNSPYAVVKANAYGCGMVEVAKYLNSIVPGFAVASLEEAILLRENEIDKDIILLEGFFDKREVQYLYKYNLTPVVHSHWQLQAIKSAKLEQKIDIWLKFNTGMNRLGLAESEILEILNNTSSAYNITTLATHFACADSFDSKSVVQASQQIISFINKHNLQDKLNLSLSNSASILNYAFEDKYPRAGINLYGISPFEFEQDNAKKLTRVVELKSQILAIHHIKKGEAVGYGETFIAQKDMRIATIAGGYGDGFSRENYKAPVIIANTRCNIIGRISMDMMVVDISNLENVQIGDEVEFWGDKLSINEVAKLNNTIAYTLITQLMPRLPRIYSY